MKIQYLDKIPGSCASTRWRQWWLPILEEFSKMDKPIMVVSPSSNYKNVYTLRASIARSIKRYGYQMAAHSDSKNGIVYVEKIETPKSEKPSKMAFLFYIFLRKIRFRKEQCNECKRRRQRFLN